MKILVLDIDGVLNSKRTDFAFGGYPQDFSLDDMLLFDPVAIALVRRLCQATSCKIVLSSTWRYFFSAEQVAAGFDLPVIDITPKITTSDYANRGNEIKEWLRVHPEVTHYAIVDDINAMLPEQQNNFVQTDEAFGLSLDNYHVLYMMLTDPDCALE